MALYVVLSYVCTVRFRGRILKQQNAKVADKPQLTINNFFPRPKDLVYSDRQTLGVVYRISCTLCNFVHYGQPERSLKALIAEQWQVSTKTSKFQAMSTISATT